MSEITMHTVHKRSEFLPRVGEKHQCKHLTTGRSVWMGVRGPGWMGGGPTEGEVTAKS